jgi:hypothetical protein
MWLDRPKFFSAWLGRPRAQDRSVVKKHPKKCKTAPTFPTQNNIKTKTTPLNCAKQFGTIFGAIFGAIPTKTPNKNAA